MSDIQAVVDKYTINEMSNEKAKNDWNKIVDVINSIDSMKQVETTSNMIKNFVKVHGKDQSHGMLELELKMKSRSLRR